jgi:DNA-binding MarR family transcriptional regulator
MDSPLAGPAGGRALSIGYLVWHLTLHWRSELDHVLAPLGLNAASYAVLASLYALSRSGTQPSQRELAAFSGLATMYVSKLARSLASTGLLERDDNPSDSRALRLKITDRGVAAVNAGRGMVLALEDQRLAPLGGRQSQASVVLRRTLQALLRHAEAAARAPQANPEAKRARRKAHRKER